MDAILPIRPRARIRAQRKLLQFEHPPLAGTRPLRFRPVLALLPLQVRGTCVLLEGRTRAFLEVAAKRQRDIRFVLEGHRREGRCGEKELPLLQLSALLFAGLRGGQLRIHGLEQLGHELPILNGVHKQHLLGTFIGNLALGIRQ